MADDDRERFDILFAGECLDGHDEGAVRDAMAKLFRADGPTLDRLFGGQRQRIKRDVDRATALKYRQAMQSAGAKAIVLRADGASDRAASSARSGPAERPDARPAFASGTTLSLEPAGGDLLRPEERSRSDVAPPSTGHLSLAAAGERLSDETASTAPAIEAPPFEVAGTGSNLGTAAFTPPPPAPDTSSIELMEGDFDLSDCQPPPATPVELDLSHLDVASSGADLLREDERRRHEGHVPDTSHLRIEGDDAP